jgi:hypothetical protein
VSARLATLASWAFAGVVAVAFVALDPAQALAPDALIAAGRAAAAALFGGLALIGAGGAALKRFAPDALAETTGGSLALVVGLGIVGAALLPVALVCGPDGVPWTLASSAALVTACLGWRTRPSLRLPQLPAGAAALGAVLLLPSLAEALAPPTDTDELYYHLALPRVLVEGGGLPGGLLHPDGSRPLPLHLVHAALLALGGEAAPRLFHLGLVAVTVASVWALAEAHFPRRTAPHPGAVPALALLGSYSFLREAGLAYNDHAVALAVLLAADAALRDRTRLAGALAGIALAVKYTAAPVLAGVGLVVLARAWSRAGRGAARPLAASLVLALLPILPWLARNAWEGLHPLFPYAGWPDSDAFTFVYPEKYGMGRGWTDTLLLPYNLVFRARPDSFAFLGRLSPLWIVVAGGGVVAAARGPARATARALLVVVVVGFAGWAAGAQLLRWLLPVSAVAALLGGAVRLRAAWLVVWLAGAVANLGPLWERAAERVAVTTGRETREEFLARELPAWPALAYLRDHVPADSPVAMLFAWHGYHVLQPTILGSVEDHVPTRWWLARHGSDALGALRRDGVTHVLVGDVAFLPSSYRFLSKEELDTAFNAPRRALRDQLLREATRLFARSRWEIWRLDGGADVAEAVPAGDVPLDAPQPPR